MSDLTLADSLFDNDGTHDMGDTFYFSEITLSTIKRTFSDYYDSNYKKWEIDDYNFDKRNEVFYEVITDILEASYNQIHNKNGYPILDGAFKEKLIESTGIYLKDPQMQCPLVTDMILETLLTMEVEFIESGIGHPKYNQPIMVKPEYYNVKQVSTSPSNSYGSVLNSV